jgi:Protein of unknown function (DUF2853)
MIRTDYTENAAKYAGSVNQAVLDGIIKFCGIALKGEDSQYVSMSDDAEIKRVCDGFAAKKLGLTEAETRAGLLKVNEQMKVEKAKMRTTVYYLLAHHTNTMSKLG